MRWSLIIVLLSIGPALAQAQSHTGTDLSGIWKLNRAQSRIKGSRGLENMLITRSGQSIQMRYTPAGSTQTYIVDGKEHLGRVFPSGSGRVNAYTTAVWRGSTLVIGIRTHLEDPDKRDTKQPDLRGTSRWSLSANHRLLAQINDIPGVPEEIMVYDKQ